MGAPHHATWHISQVSARGLEGEALLREAHGFPPDSPDLCMQRSVAPEQSYDDSKALVRTCPERRPVLDGCAGTHPTLGPDRAMSPPVWTPVQGCLYCSRRSNDLPYHVWTASSVPLIVSLKFLLFHPYSLSCPSPETVVLGIPPGKSAASERHAIKPRLEPLNPPDLNGELLDEAGGVWRWACLRG